MTLDNQNLPPDNIPSSSTIISDILIKYNLKETEDELVKKYFGDNISESNGHTIFWVASKLKVGEKTEKDLASVFIERLHIDQKTAEQLLKDIQEKLLPVLKTNIEKKYEVKKNQVDLTKDILEKLKLKIVPAPKKRERIKKNISETKPKSEPDNYRELIE